MNVGRTTGSPIEVQDEIATENSQAATAPHAHVPADWLEKFRATSAKRSAFTTGEQITITGPIGVEFGATIKYEDMRIGPRVTQPHFTIKTEGGIPHSVSAERPMTKAEMRAVLKGLESQLSSPSLGRRLDRAALTEMVDKLAAATAEKKKTSTLFDDVRWADATKLRDGSFVARGGKGVDQVVEVSLDKNGKLGYQTRIAGRPTRGEAFHPLSKADREDLARSIQKLLESQLVPEGSPWVKLLSAAQK